MNARRLTVAVFSLLFLGSCGVWQKTKNLVGLGPNDVKSIGMMASGSAGRHAVVIEVAFAYSDASLAVVTSSDATQWFSQRPGYCSSYGNQLDVMRLELPRGYSAMLTELPEGYKSARAIFVFVENLGKADITNVERPWLTLTETELTVASLLTGADGKSKSRGTNTGIKRLC